MADKLNFISGAGKGICCSKCYAFYLSGTRCPECGHKRDVAYY